jgi:Trk K+ transport system NAD-binding subunit
MSFCILATAGRAGARAGIFTATAAAAAAAITAATAAATAAAAATAEVPIRHARIRESVHKRVPVAVRRHCSAALREKPQRWWNTAR